MYSISLGINWALSSFASIVSDGMVEESRQRDGDASEVLDRLCMLALLNASIAPLSNLITSLSFRTFEPIKPRYLLKVALKLVHSTHLSNELMAKIAWPFKVKVFSSSPLSNTNLSRRGRKYLDMLFPCKAPSSASLTRRRIARSRLCC